MLGSGLSQAPFKGSSRASRDLALDFLDQSYATSTGRKIRGHLFIPVVVIQLV